MPCRPLINIQKFFPPGGESNTSEKTAQALKLLKWIQSDRGPAQRCLRLWFNTEHRRGTGPEASVAGTSAADPWGSPGGCLLIELHLMIDQIGGRGDRISV